MSSRRSATHTRSMPAIASFAVAQSTPPSSFPIQLKNAMKKFFRPNNINGGANIPDAIPAPVSDKSRSRSNTSSFPSQYDDGGSSRRGKSVDGRLDVTGTMGAGTSVVELTGSSPHNIMSIVTGGDASPLSTLKQRLRPKSLQPPASPSKASTPETDLVLPRSHDLLTIRSQPVPVPDSTSLHVPLSPPRIFSDSDIDSGCASYPRRALNAPNLSTPSPATVPTYAHDIHHNSPDATSGSKSGGEGGPPTPAIPRAALNGFDSLTQSALPPSRPLPAPPPGAPECPPCANKPPPVALRLRVDSASLPPRLPILPIPAPFEAPLSSSDIPASPTNIYYGGGEPSISSPHPLRTPQPPGAFHSASQHQKARSMTLPSSSSSPISPRRLANASTPGTYVMPLTDAGGYGPPRATTLKMTPSLVMSRPSAPLMAPTPMRYPSLLVSGVSMGDREPDTSSAWSSTMGRSRTEGDAAVRHSPTANPRPIRSALPALRRDGSSFYMNMARPGTSSDTSEPPGAMHDDEAGTDSDDDMDMEGDHGMDHDEMPASDDESEETAGAPVSKVPLLGGMAKAVRAMASPFTPGTPKTGPTTPSAAGQTPSSPSSYFRARPSEVPALHPTPIARPSSGSGGTGPSLATAAHRKSLAASGAPSMLLSTVQDDHDGEARHGSNTTPQAQKGRDLPSSSSSTPRQAPKQTLDTSFNMPIPRGPTICAPPASQRDTLYSTPPATPTPSALSEHRSTVYYDAESDLERVERPGLVDPGAGSAFTTYSTGSTSTLTASATGVATLRQPAPVTSTPSALTIRPVMDAEIPRRPAVHSETLASSGSSGESALGLQFPVTQPEGTATLRIARTVSQQPPETPSANRKRTPSTSRDYFSSKSPAAPSEPSDLRASVSSRPPPRVPMVMGTLSPRTPGGRPMMYSQMSHSMLDFGSLMMDEPSEIALGDPQLRGKGKEKEGAKVIATEQSIVKGHMPMPMPMPTSPRTRRRSLPEMSGLHALPPPYPKFSVREEEGKEVLPPYTCRIHFEASLLRKMEFSHPGTMARDRAWKRVYVVLNGTSLTIFKHNPRVNTVKPVTSRVGTRGTVKSYPAGGRMGDGVVGVEDVVVGALHVHLPQEVLQTTSGTIGAPLKKTTSGGSGGSGERPTASSSRRSFDATSRRSADGGRRATTGGSRSSMSSSSNNTARSSTTGITSPSSSSSNLDLLDGREESEKRAASSHNAPGRPTSVFGAARPSNSQSNHLNPGSQLLASLQSNVVLRQFSLQNAETGLASDYHKRKNVIRVRADGEQFLLQADNVLMAIDWIETFQAGANVALDIDERPMPKVPALPRRRRRRRTTRDEAAPTPAAIPPSAAPTGAPATPSDPNPIPATATSSSSRFSFGRRRDANA